MLYIFYICNSRFAKKKSWHLYHRCYFGFWQPQRQQVLESLLYYVIYTGCVCVQKEKKMWLITNYFHTSLVLLYHQRISENKSKSVCCSCSTCHRAETGGSVRPFSPLGSTQLFTPPLVKQLLLTQVFRDVVTYVYVLQTSSSKEIKRSRPSTFSPALCS